MIYLTKFIPKNYTQTDMQTDRLQRKKERQTLRERERQTVRHMYSHMPQQSKLDIIFSSL